MAINLSKIGISFEELRGHSGASFSLLKEMDREGPRSLIERKKYKSDAIDLGSMVDILLFEPEEFEGKFYTKAIVKPTGQILELADYIIENSLVDRVLANTDELLDIRNDLGLFKNRKKEDELLKHLLASPILRYLKASKEAEGKIIFSPEQHRTAVQAVDTLRTHWKTSDIFVNKKGEETIYQFCYVYDCNGVNLRVVLDAVKVNHIEKTIQPYDLKTGYRPIGQFTKMFTENRYELQSSIYSLALQSIVESVEEFKDYKVLPFKFIYISTSNPSIPQIWTVPEKWHTAGLVGYSLPSGYRVKGVYELVEDFKWYYEYQEFMYRRELVENAELDIPIPNYL